MVLWTRVTPSDDSAPGSGRGPRVEVRWEVAKDRRFRRVVRRGSVTTGLGRDHTVKVDVRGLSPATDYYYRFALRGVHSRVGRTRTAPARGATPRNVRLGVVSCANWQAGYFAAYRGLAARDDLHAVVHLGDYLYEYGPEEDMAASGLSGKPVLRPHDPPREMVSLEDYRRRHAQYKTDPDLQDAHARHPWIVVWDDHESTNNSWRDGAGNHDPETEGDWHRRRARAHRAYDEWMPVRMAGTAEVGDGDRLFRRLRFGRLLELSVLDLRSYRDEQVSPPAVNAAASDPARTLTGKRQMRWLKRSLTRRAAQWKVIGTPVMFAPLGVKGLPDDVVRPLNQLLDLVPEDGFYANADQWDGYTADRNEVLATIRDEQVSDVVFITGDIHSAWAAEIPYDASLYPVAGENAAVEFVATSVTSANLKDILGTPARHPLNLAVEQAIVAANPHMKHLNFDDHGFSVLDVTEERTQMDWFVIGDRTDRRTPITWSASFATHTGTASVVRVDRPVDP